MIESILSSQENILVVMTILEKSPAILLLVQCMSKVLHGEE